MTDILEITTGEIAVDTPITETVEIGYVSGGFIPVPGPKGDTGDTGPQGAPGAPGASGATGATGLPGAAGAQGAAGDTGPAGPKGDAGSQGPPGADGGDGLDGIGVPIAGTTGQLLAKASNTDYDTHWITGGGGATGPPGADGDSAYQVALDNGFVGTQAQWLASLVGSQGIQGIQGVAGVEGPQGPTGATGGVGPKGDIGDTGPAGEQGPQGTTGLQGVQGDDGPQGIQGIQGDDGPQGIQGVKGDTGLTGSPGADGAQGIQGIQGVKGDTGIQGVHGTDGPAVFVYSLAGELSPGTGTFKLYNDSGKTWTIVSVRASVGTAPTGTFILLDFNKGTGAGAATTIFTTQANRPQIAVSTNTVKATNMNITAVADGDYLTIDIDQVGSTVKGSNLVVQMTVV